jgi:hypothetical protein
MDELLRIIMNYTDQLFRIIMNRSFLPGYNGIELFRIIIKKN